MLGLFKKPELPSHLRNRFQEVYVPYVTKSRAGVKYTHYKRMLKKLSYKRA